ncbi:MAG: nuclear transport factor 2 family protein [Rhodoferax sp.]
MTTHSVMPAPVAELVAFYEALSPHSLPRLRTLYAPQARFKDPFNAVQGVEAIEQIMAHMFTALEAPRFRVIDCVSQGRQAFVTWDFSFSVRRFRGGQPQCIHGATQWVFDDTGRVLLHRDYWDAAEELYEKLPLLGALMRALKAALRTPVKTASSL